MLQEQNEGLRLIVLFQGQSHNSTASMHPLQGMQQTMQRVQQQNPLNQMQRAQHPHTSVQHSIVPSSQRAQQFGHQAAPQVGQIGSVTLQRVPAVSSQSQQQPNVQVGLFSIFFYNKGVTLY